MENQDSNKPEQSKTEEKKTTKKGPSKKTVEKKNFIESYKDQVKAFTEDYNQERLKLAEKHNIPKCSLCDEYVFEKEKITSCFHVFHNMCLRRRKELECPVCGKQCKPKPKVTKQASTEKDKDVEVIEDKS